MLAVETYLAQPAAAVEIVSAAGYFRATKAVAADPAIAARAREAGTALGADPPAAVAQIATRVLALVETQDDTASIRTIAGDIRLRDYLPTRTFELAVHTADLATALGLPPDIPATAAAQALYNRRRARHRRWARRTGGPLLLAVTGRTGLPAAARCSAAASLLSPPGAPGLRDGFINDGGRRAGARSACSRPERRTQAVKIGQTSLPIALGLGLLLMMYLVLAKVRYREIGRITADRRMMSTSLTVTGRVAIALASGPSFPQCR